MIDTLYTNRSFSMPPPARIVTVANAYIPEEAL